MRTGKWVVSGERMLNGRGVFIFVVDLQRRVIISKERVELMQRGAARTHGKVAE